MKKPKNKLQSQEALGTTCKPTHVFNPHFRSPSSIQPFINRFMHLQYCLFENTNLRDRSGHLHDTLRFYFPKLRSCVYIFFSSLVCETKREIQLYSPFSCRLDETNLIPNRETSLLLYQVQTGSVTHPAFSFYPIDTSGSFSLRM